MTQALIFLETEHRDHMLQAKLAQFREISLASGMLNRPLKPGPHLIVARVTVAGPIILVVSEGGQVHVANPRLFQRPSKSLLR